MPASAVTPDLPPPVAHIWTWFWQLERSRQGGFGAQSFTYQEVEAFARLMQVEIHPWEVVAIIALDDARRGVWAETEERSKAASPLRKVVDATNARAVEALFDGFVQR